MSETLFRIHNVHYRYKLDGQWVPALNGVDAAITSGRVTCLSGPSGSGKSTLLNLLGLLDAPASGELTFQNRNVVEMSERERERLRLHELGFIFQSFNLFPALSAEENVEYFLAKQGVATADRKARTRDALSAVGILDQAKKRPNQMSGGQRQRVAIARALAKRPKVVLADEPTASLDRKNGQEVVSILKTLSRERGLTVLIASHDNLVLDEADVALKLRDGRVETA